MKRSIGRLSLCIAAVLGSSYASAQDLPNYDAYFDANAAPSVAPGAKLSAANPLGFAASFDERRGVPSFVWASKQQALPPKGVARTSEAAARWYVRENARTWDVPRAALDGIEVVKVHDTGRGGIIVTLRQSIDGIEVHQGEIKVLMNRNLELVAITGSPRGTGAAETKKSGRVFKIAPDQAITKAFTNLYGVNLKTSDLRDAKNDKGGYKFFELTSGAVKDREFVHPARVKKVFFTMPDQVVPAYFLEMFAGKVGETDSDAYAYVISALDGRVLLRRNLTEYETFNYRVWTEADGTPLDGPQANFTPHPTGVPDGSAPAFIPPNLMAMEGFNTNPSLVADPWLPNGATQTLGNNVDAYTDDEFPDGLSAGDMRATTTSLNTFDYTYDTALGPLANNTQKLAAVTQLFYTTNWLHDWFYDSGFNEAAGNAQADNFGRGGLGGDVLLGQAQDAAVLIPGAPAGTTGRRNNANMNTPADGMSPRMQMYLWSGPSARSLTINPNNQVVASGTASFGPQNFNFTDDLVAGVDGVLGVPVPPAAPGTFNDGCETITSDVVGKIALVDRGFCGFIVKAANLSAAGAVGMIVANNAPNVAPPGLGGGTDPALPATLSVTQETGVALRAQILSGPTTATMYRLSSVERDGSLDGNIVAHEWGHYIHHRLVNCGLNQCRGMSEGWGDFVALYTSIREGDNLDAAYAMAGYSTATFGPNSGYFGIRRAPFSTDFNFNALTFKHAQDGILLPTHPLASASPVNSEVHNVGEIWASMMFEGYIALLKESEGPNPRYTFQEARRLMSDYIVAGMAMAQREPTVTQQRDSILAAAYANEPLDMLLLANAFAKRGFGTCAESPPIDTVSFAGLVESFGVQSNLAFVDMTFDDSIASCDMDGLLDAEERGEVKVTIRNAGIATLTNTQATLSTLFSGVTFPNGPTVSFGSIEPFATATATVEIALGAGVQEIEHLPLQVELTDPAVCNPTSTSALVRRGNYDNVPNMVAFDTVESNILAWTGTQIDGIDIWTRHQAAPENHVWLGLDISNTADAFLVSPDLVVGNTDPLILTMEHHWSFEANATVNFDAGVIELTEDGGATWVDVSTYVNPGYNGIVNEPSNALSGRSAFVGASPGYPANQTLALNFGVALAGKTIKLRYRIATDGGVGAPGWEIDNIAFLGLTNTPFPGIVKDVGTCDGLPIANAGPDQTTQAANEVILDASGSSDPDGDPLTFQWTQVAGPAVSLTDASAATPMFTAPSLADGATLTFKVHASDGVGATSDAVNIVVDADPGAGGAGGGGGQGGQGGGNGGAGAQGGEGGITGPGPSSGSGPGTATSGGQTLPDGEDGGCGCSVVGDSDGEPQTRSLAALLAAAALLIQRRRRSSKRSVS